MAFDRRDRFLDAFGEWVQLQPEFSQPIAGRMALCDRLAEVLLELGKAAMNGRLADTQRLGGRDRAALRATDSR